MRRMLSMMTAVMLTATLGRVTYQNHVETWYDLSMDKVIERTDEALGLSNLYWIRDDGVKMYAQWVIVAAHPSKIRYSIVDTSLGEGIILDTHTCEDPELIDIATDWKE